MSIENELLNYKNQTNISKEILVDLIKKEKPDYKEASIRWKLFTLVQEGLITKIDSECFRTGRVNPYIPKHGSNGKNQIVHILRTKFPAIKAVVYELTILNEWLNHQLARNILFVEVEKQYMSFVFRTLQEDQKLTILLKPSVEDFYLYASDATTIVSNLITQAPVHKDSYDIRIEKLIVDLFSDGLLSELIGDGEIGDMLDGIFSTYVVNTKTIFAYAKRRKLEARMRVALQNYI